jgi:hypothetical protein
MLNQTTGCIRVCSHPLEYERWRKGTEVRARLRMSDAADDAWYSASGPNWWG